MCFEIINGPAVTPKQISAPREVTVRIKLRSATPATATVSCDPGALGPTKSRPVKLTAAGVTVSFSIQVGAVAPGAYPIVVQVDQPGCDTEQHVTTLVVLIPKAAVKS